MPGTHRPVLPSRAPTRSASSRLFVHRTKAPVPVPRLICAHPALAVTIAGPVSSVLTLSASPESQPGVLVPRPNPRPRRAPSRGGPWTRRRCWRCTAATGAGSSASSSPPAAGAAAPSISPASTSTPSAPTTRSSASPKGKPGRAPSVPAREPWSCVFDRRRRIYSPDGSSSDQSRRPF